MTAQNLIAKPIQCTAQQGFFKTSLSHLFLTTKISTDRICYFKAHFIVQSFSWPIIIFLNHPLTHLSFTIGTILTSLFTHIL